MAYEERRKRVYEVNLLAKQVLVSLFLISILSIAQAQIQSSVEAGFGFNSGIEAKYSNLSKQDITSVSDLSFKGTIKACYLTKINLYLGTGLSYFKTNFNTLIEQRNFVTVGLPIYLGYKVNVNRLVLFADAGIEFKVVRKIGYVYSYESEKSIIGNVGCEYKLSHTILPFIGFHLDNGRYSMDNFINNPIFYGFSLGIRLRFHPSK